MPNAPLKPCADRLCPELVPRGTRRCAKHQSQVNATFDRTRAGTPGRKLYSSARWRKVRALVLSREPLCRACRRAPATEVDHIVPIAQGGAVWDTDNMQALCKRDHSRKTASEVLNT